MTGQSALSREVLSKRKMFEKRGSRGVRRGNCWATGRSPEGYLSKKKTERARYGGQDREQYGEEMSLAVSCPTPRSAARPLATALRRCFDEHVVIPGSRMRYLTQLLTEAFTMYTTVVNKQKIFYKNKIWIGGVECR